MHERMITIRIAAQPKGCTVPWSQVGAMLLVRILVSLAFTTTAFATTYYVAPNGSDSSPGTLSQPFLTLQHAANTVTSGDTVIVENGTYTVTGSGPIVNFPASASGTSTNYTTFQAQNQYGAVLDGNANTVITGVEFTGNYIRFQGFELKNISEEAISTYQGGNNIDIVGNKIHDIGRFCTDSTTGRDGIFIASANDIVEQNLIYDIGRYAPGESGCSPATSYYNNHDHGIYVDGAFNGGVNNLIIRDNIFYRIERGWGIQVYPNAVGGLAILNNTFMWANPWQVGHIIFAGGGATNLRVENNISYSPLTSFLHFYDTSGYTGTVAHNMTYNGTVSDATPSGVTFTANNDNTDPKLVSVGDSTIDDGVLPDAHLTAGSPAIGSGVTLPEVTVDFSGAPRSNPPSIGALEFTSTGAPPPPPTKLTVVVH